MKSGNLIILIVLSGVLTIALSWYTSRIHALIFCDVGQGAATLLQYGSFQLLVDTGGDARVLSCVGRHIPYFDRTIEYVVISHNQKDHKGGLSFIQKKYLVSHLIDEIDSPVKLQFDELLITIRKASESAKNINDAAHVVTISTPSQTVFLPSDINGVELKRLIPQNTTILEVPHHGSRYGLYPDSLDLAQPTLAVISVGKKNSYGHPSKEALDILRAKKIKIWRTDEQGELVINL